MGWQVFDTHCREQAEEGECVWACPLHRHTAGVCSQPSRTRERERDAHTHTHTGSVTVKDSERKGVIRKRFCTHRESKMGGVSTGCVWEVTGVEECLCMYCCGYSMSR